MHRKIEIQIKKQIKIQNFRKRLLVTLALVCLPSLLFGNPQTPILSGVDVYKKISADHTSKRNTAFVNALLLASQQIPQASTKKAIQFKGNLRKISINESTSVFMIRDSQSRKMYVAMVPAGDNIFQESKENIFSNFEKNVEFKASYNVTIIEKEVQGKTVQFARLNSAPVRGLLDKLFFIAIVLLLFSVMVGMGMTLKVIDFTNILKTPKAMLIGPATQVGLLPLLALLLGTISGIKEAYPFVFIGLILVSASPGGVTSNLMTYWGKGDLALSVSMTAFSTVLSIFFTPALLSLYVTGIPDVKIPILVIIKQIMILVIVPLFIGMFIRAKAEAFALKSKKAFSILGVFALFFLIITGVLNNLEVLNDVDRYGIKFYAVIFSLTIFAMLLSIVIAKLFKISNFQARAISLETGLQNASLAMTIAILLQDRMGDYNASMFAVSGIFGLWMYIAGGIMIYLFPKMLPLENSKS